MRHAIKTLTLLSAAGLALATLNACTPVVKTHGNIVTADLETEIKPNETTRSDILAMFGSPTTKSVLSDLVWYYIGEQTEQTAFFRPDVVERNVLKVTFNMDETVEKVEVLNKDDGQSIYIIDRTTPTSGRKLNALQQILGNVGRFTPDGK